MYNCEWVFEETVAEKFGLEKLKSLFKKLDMELHIIKCDLSKVPSSRYLRNNPFTGFNYKNTKEDTSVIFIGGEKEYELFENFYPKHFYLNFHSYKNFFSSFMAYHMDNLDLFLYIIVPWYDIKNNKEKYFKMLDCDSLFFFSTETFNSFTSSSITKENFEKTVSKIDDIPSIYPTSLICITAGKNIKSEYRAVVVDKKVISCSKYKNYGKSVDELSNNKKVIELATKSASIFTRHEDAYCCDIAELDDGSYKIIKYRDIATSLLYSMELEKIVKEVSKVMEGKDF